ncbi:MAG: hypothetical protein HQL82_06200 [Magnetococcales bacterium]|nr:hypothetical protein [Magnetococcales bacterium]
MQEFGIRDIYFQIFTHLRGMWRHRWHMILVAWFVSLTGWTAVFFMEDQYVSHARVMIEDPQNQLRSYLKEMEVRIDVTVEARQVLNGLLRRSNLVKVIQGTSLAKEIRSEEDLERHIVDLRAQVAVNTQGNNMYVISHRHTNPRVTQQVVQGMLNILNEGPLQQMTEDGAREAQRFLDEQIGKYEAKVTEAETRMQVFKRKNSSMLMLPGEEGGYYQRLKKLQSDIEAGNIKVRELQERKDALHRQMDDIIRDLSRPEQEATAAPAKDNSSIAAGIDQEIRQLEGQLSELLGRYYMRGGEKRFLYTETHAEVVALRQSIAVLQQQKQEVTSQFQEERPKPVQRDPKDDPVYRQALLTLSQVEVELASTRARVQEHEAAYQQLKSQENTLPAIEAELIRLERNVKHARDKMMELMQTEGKARFSGDVAEGLSSKVKFKIIDLPNLPYAPSGPNRPLFLTVVLLGGMLAGLAMALFLSVMRPVFDTPSSLKKELGLPVLGTVSMVREGTGPVWLGSGLFFGSVAGGLMVLYAIVMYFQME